MVCPTCGRRTYKDERICPRCGAKMPKRERIMPTYQSDMFPTPSVRRQSDYTEAQEQPIYTEPEPVYAEPVYVAPEPVYVPEPEPVPEPVYTAPEPVYVPEPEPVYAPPEPQPEPEPVYTPPAREKKKPTSDDSERTLTIAEAKSAPRTASTAAAHYSRLRSGIIGTAAADDGSVVKLERLPEGYVYVKMTVEEANARKFAKLRPIAFGAVALVAVIAVVALIIILRGTEPAIVGQWGGSVNAQSLGLPLDGASLISTEWKFENDGSVEVQANISGMVQNLNGTYSLTKEDDRDCINIELSSMLIGQLDPIDAYYSIEDTEEGEKLTISLKENEKLQFSLERDGE